MHDEFRAMGARAPLTKCSCGSRHREWFNSGMVGGVDGVEDSFARWSAARGHPYWIKTRLSP